MKYLKLFENYNSDDIANRIKQYLIDDNYLPDEYDSFEDGWKKFIDNQEIGDCQGIVHSILFFAKQNNIPNIEKNFGDIENDEHKLMTHHWITINDEIYEFSKGTLKNYIDFYDLYSVEPEYIERYKQINL